MAIFVFLSMLRLASQDPLCTGCAAMAGGSFGGAINVWWEAIEWEPGGGFCFPSGSTCTMSAGCDVSGLTYGVENQSSGSIVFVPVGSSSGTVIPPGGTAWFVIGDNVTMHCGESVLLGTVRGSGDAAQAYCAGCFWI